MTHALSTVLAAVLATLAVQAEPARSAPAPAALFAAAATAITVEGTADLADVVACFGSEARLPSFAHIAHYPDVGEAVYRLRFDGLLFETIRFVRSGQGGTRAEVLLAGSYSRAERAHYASARGEALARCLARPMLVAATASPVMGTGL